MDILFDLDGTLTDPREGILGCVRHALAALDRACPPEHELLAFIGPPLGESFASLLGDARLAARALDLYRERFSVRGLFQNLVYPGIEEALATLALAGARLHVATSKPTVYAERIVEHFGLARYFDAVHGSELGGARSDKRELIAHVLQVRRIPASRAWMVGDREHDMRGAAANGVRAAGALWGYGTREELLAAGALRLCERAADLPEVLA